jgi:isochorismate hydrolase
MEKPTDMKNAGDGSVESSDLFCAPVPAAERWRDEMRRRVIAIEDEQQTYEDHLYDENYGEAEYYLTRMISEARKLEIHMKARPIPQNNEGQTTA